MLNAKQLRALAREARKLASDVCEGTAPEFNPNDYCGCAIGALVYRALGVRVLMGAEDNFTTYNLAVAIDEHLPDYQRKLGIVSRELQDNGPDALPFPLHALADELDLAAKGRPQKELHP